MSKKILITGGLGYVGGRIAAHLAEKHPKDSLRLMTHRTVDQAAPWTADIKIFQADLRDESSLISCLDGIDTVVHMAAVNEVQSQQDPDLALQVNGKGTHTLLKAAAKQGVSRFIYFSTFHVYGPDAPQIIDESTPTRPVHPYAITHRLAEDYVNWHRHSFNLDSLVIRLSNGYGYPMDSQVNRWTLLINDLCQQASKNGEIRLRSSGSQHRDFIALSDVSRAVEHFLAMPANSWQDGLFNLGGECSMSILDIAQRVAREFKILYGKELPVIAGENQDSAGARPVGFRIDKIKSTGFSIQGDMSHEIQKTLEFCSAI